MHGPDASQEPSRSTTTGGCSSRLDSRRRTSKSPGSSAWAAWRGPSAARRSGPPNHRACDALTEGRREAGSAAEAVPCLLCKLLGRRVDHRLPVQTLEVRHIRSVEGLEVRPAYKSEAEHVAVSLRRSPVDGQVEALVAKLAVEPQRSRDALGQILYVGFGQLDRRGHTRHEGSDLVEAERGKAREPLNAPQPAQVALAQPLLGVQVVAEMNSRYAGQQLLDHRRMAIEAALNVGMEKGAARRQHVIGVDRGPARGGVITGGLRQEVHLSAKVVRDDRRPHRLERHVVQVRRVDGDRAVQRVRLDVGEENRLAAVEPALGNQRRRELRRDHLQARRTEEAVLSCLAAKGLQVEVGRRQEAGARHDPRAVPDERIPADFNAGRRRLVVAPRVEDLGCLDFALELHWRGTLSSVTRDTCRDGPSAIHPPPPASPGAPPTSHPTKQASWGPRVAGPPPPGFARYSPDFPPHEAGFVGTPGRGTPLPRLRRVLPRLRGGEASVYVRATSAVPSTSVPALMNMPPTPWATLTFTPGTWAAASPRSCRTDSWMANIPYIPVCVYERPPPLVFSGSLPPGSVLPSEMKAPASPRPTKPRSSRP